MIVRTDIQEKYDQHLVLYFFPLICLGPRLLISLIDGAHFVGIVLILVYLLVSV